MRLDARVMRGGEGKGERETEVVRMGVRETAREGMTVEVGACEGKRV